MKWTLIFSLILLTSCIGEDIIFDEVEPQVRLTNPIAQLEVGTSYQFEYMFLNNVGLEVTPMSIEWSSSNETIVSITEQGLVTAHVSGLVTIELTASYEDQVATQRTTFQISEEETMELETTRSGSIRTTSTYPMEGTFSLQQEGDDLILRFFDDYVADTRLPGLYIYLTNNPNTTNGALEIDRVTNFSGSHSYTIPNTDILTYEYVLYFCKPFDVKVGDGKIN